MSVPYTHDRRKVSEFRDKNMTNMDASVFAAVMGYNLAADYEHVRLEVHSEEGEPSRDGVLLDRLAEAALDHHCAFVTGLQYQGANDNRLLAAGFRRNPDKKGSR